MGNSVEERSSASPAEKLRQVRPAQDGIARDDVRARAERALFGEAEPARLGRYVLLGRIAGGGMGVVYGAYDPDLHRKVALKVLHPQLGDTAQGHQRLLAEARALAKLDHPNVVKVHDVITHDSQVVVVMVLVEGLTLADWQLVSPRSWQEVVAAYHQAGEGLAAAHAVKVIHRDFKPANAIIGANGRVQVLDFGLARLAGSEPIAHGPERNSALALESTALTATGNVVGTLGYMSPEQLGGEPATPASDQFSFCISLHRALEGVAPFVGQDPVSLGASIKRGAIAYAADGRVVPKWLRSVIRRGLAAAPEARYPSLRVLLDQLGRERGWRRWRTPALGLSALTMVSAMFLVQRPAEGTAPCDGGAIETAGVWGAAQRVHVRSRLHALAAPIMLGLDTRIPDQLDGYERAWRGAHRDACLAYRRGTQSADLFDRRMLCLSRHLDDLDATVRVLTQLDERSLPKAIEVVAGIPGVEDCADVEALKEASALPAMPALKAEIASVQEQLSQAAAFERVGRDGDALQAVRQARGRARRAGYAPAMVEAALLEGQVLLFSHEFKAAIGPLAEAEALALENRMYPAAVEAAARRLFCEGVEGAPLEAVEPRIAMMSSLGRGLHNDHFAWPLLLNNAGVIYVANRQRGAAARYFQAAQAALAGVPHPDFELIAIEKNLAMVTADRRSREALSRSAWQRLDAALGAAHPLSIEALEDHARYVMDPILASAQKRRACALYEQFHAAQIGRRAACLSHLAFLETERGDQDAATKAYAEVARLTVDTTDDDARVWGRLAAGQLALTHGDLRAAIATFSAIVADYGASDHWWEQTWVGHALLGVGQAEHLRGDDRAAEHDLERAAAIYVDLGQITELVENHQRLALVRWTLAAVLTQLARPRDQIAALEAQARQYYLAASPEAYHRRLVTTSR